MALPLHILRTKFILLQREAQETLKTLKQDDEHLNEVFQALDEVLWLASLDGDVEDK